MNAQKLSYTFKWQPCSAVYYGCTIVQQPRAAPQRTHQMKQEHILANEAELNYWDVRPSASSAS